MINAFTFCNLRGKLGEKSQLRSLKRFANTRTVVAPFFSLFISHSTSKIIKNYNY